MSLRERIFSFKREFIFLLLCLAFGLLIIFPFLVQFLLGITLAFLVEPMYDSIQLKINPKKKIWKSYFIAFSALFLMTCLVLAPIVTFSIVGIQELYNWISGLNTSLKSDDYFHNILVQVSNLTSKYGYPMNVEELKHNILDSVNKQSTEILKAIGSFLGGTPTFFIHLFVVFLTWFFFLVDGKNYRSRFFNILFPWKKERKLISQTISNLIKALFLANGIIAFIQAFLISILLFMLNVPNFILLSALSFFISFIPVVGTAPVTVGTAAWCYFSRGDKTSAVVILICAVFIGVIDNILRPLLMKGKADIQFYWIFLAILGGLSVFGIAGAILGPLAFALFSASFQTYEVFSQNRE